MAIDLSAVSGPWAFRRAAAHATPGNLEVVTIPDWCKTLTIRAAGSGSLKLASEGTQDAAVGSHYLTLEAGQAVTFRSVHVSRYALRLTGTVSSDPVEFILESAMGS